MTGDLGYGHARVRARKASLLDAAALARLVRLGDVGSLLGELATTRYRADVEAAVLRHRGLRAVDEALRLHLGRSGRELLRWYRGRGAERGLARLVEAWDRHDLRVLLRGLARLAPADELLASLVPGARLEDAALRALAASEGLREAVDRLAWLGLPTPTVAHALVAAFPAYEAARGDVRVLERAVEAAWPDGADDPGLDPVAARALRRARDRRGLDVALRLRAARRRGHGVEGLGGVGPLGALPRAALDGVVAAETREEATASLARHVPRGWRAALAAWARDGDAAALADALDEVDARADVAGFWRGDPETLAVPVAYLAAVAQEARTLRRIARGLEDGAPPAAFELPVVAP